MNLEVEPNIVISGAGIAGLVLALSLRKMGVAVTVYEQAPSFDDGVGGAIGLYPNGLRVIRDISIEVLREIRKQGRSYIYRRWMRHDGSEVAVGQEKYLCEFKDEKEEEELTSLGIRRWRLQKILVTASERMGVKIIWGKRINLVKVIDPENDIKVELTLSDNSKVNCDLLFGCDGVKSAIRTSLFGNEADPSYTGITCLMGSAPIAKKSPLNGICFPSSVTSKCHACFYPCNEEEIIFQIYFPTEEKPETWKPLTLEESKIECNELAKTLKNEGWSSIFTDCLLSADSVLRVGLRARSPIPVWHSPKNNPRVILLGDAAHPPVPYIGQGAMMAIEDAGILSLLIKSFCKPNEIAKFNLNNLPIVSKHYEGLRLPRTTTMLEKSHELGKMQLERATNTNKFEIWYKEMTMWANVKRFGTLPIMLNGASYNYQNAVEEELRKSKL
ncbi:hypothetical protein HDU92_000061 [Lobulomyces angularis]|nr:hypothetical protein HDU92_000061 [Lobulomyces angularis]